MTRLHGSPWQVGPQGLVANVGLDEGGKATQIQTKVGRGWEPVVLVLLAVTFPQ